MLLSNEIQITIKAPTINYFRELGYNVNINDKISIPIYHLKTNSHVKVQVKCDICDNQKELSFSKYNQNINRYGYYTCGKKCAVNKSKTTNLQKLGVDNPMKSDEIINKITSNFIKKHGTAFFMQTDEFKNKAKKTKKEKYGDENYNNRGVATKTLINNYEKTLNTNRNKYGCDYTFQNTQVKEKIKNSKIKSGNQVPDENLSAWQIYKRDVRVETYKFKKQLFEEWNGYDFYDGEYIKENFSLLHTNRNYPTIDHKISIHYGFLNNIPVNEIGNIKNLCITKRSINSSKNNRPI